MCDDFLYHHNVLTHHFLFYHYQNEGLICWSSGAADGKQRGQAQYRLTIFPAGIRV
ncbi:MAG: hypothetical protein ACTFAK_04075 [Candidatus Electronema sp. VV]